MVRDPVCGTFVLPSRSHSTRDRSGARPLLLLGDAAARPYQRRLTPCRGRPSSSRGAFLRRCSRGSRPRATSTSTTAPDAIPRDELLAARRRQAGADVPADRPRRRRGARRRRRTCASSPTSPSATTTSTSPPRASAGHRRHQHAGRADRGDGGLHLGADPRGRRAASPRASGWCGAANGRAGRSTSCSASELRGKQLGIVGLGRSARAVARARRRVRHARSRACTLDGAGADRTARPLPARTRLDAARRAAGDLGRRLAARAAHAGDAAPDRPRARSRA